MSIKRKRIIVLAIGIALLLISILLAGKGYLMPLILLFPSYLIIFPINDTLAGIVACIQVPVYVYLITLGKTKKRKLLIAGALILVHLLLISYAINRSNTRTTSLSPVKTLATSLLQHIKTPATPLFVTTAKNSNGIEFLLVREFLLKKLLHFPTNSRKM